MNTIDKIKNKIPGLPNYYNQKALIWRNRGDSYALEIVDAVRIKYNDKPNVHELSTGEVIPAVPKSYTSNLYGSGSYFCAVEGDDDQLVIWKPQFKVGEFIEDTDESELSSLPVDIESSVPGDKILERLEDKNFDAVNFAVLDNRDERFTFLSEEVKTSEDKYSLTSILYQHPEAIMLVTMAVAVAIIVYGVSGDIPSALNNFGDQMNQLSGQMQNLNSQLNSTATPPPGN